MTDLTDIAAVAQDARQAFLDWLRDECGDEAADCREDSILDGHEDNEQFIVGYLVAVRAYLTEQSK